MGQELRSPVGRLRRQPLQHIQKMGIGLQPVELGRVDQAHHSRGPLSRAQAAGEEPVLPSAMDRMRFSTQLLLIGRHPSRRSGHRSLPKQTPTPRPSQA